VTVFTSAGLEQWDSQSLFMQELVVHEVFEGPLTDCEDADAWGHEVQHLSPRPGAPGLSVSDASRENETLCRFHSD
jgi:hypothetical protein